MIPELDAVFTKYEALVKQVDDVFEKVRLEHPDCVKCQLECADCCHALFDLSLVEALYLNRHFLAAVTDARKEEILAQANKTDRDVYRLKRKAFKAVESGEKTEEQVLLEMAAERVRCPLLNTENRCEMYSHRPITCRLYGIPTSINGRGHTCGLSDFKEGQAYPTVNLDAVNDKLHALSQEVVGLLQSKHVKMGDLLMPLSMALLTVFDASYLGLPSAAADTDNPQAQGS
jgi:Fe-S-cluster containining protein